MSVFAKDFRSEKYGQIVAIQQSDDDGDPEIRLFFKPENLGVCSLALGFHDWDKCDQQFERIDLDLVEQLLKQPMESALTITSNT